MESVKKKKYFVEITSPEDLDDPKLRHRGVYVRFNCVRCGKIVERQFRHEILPKIKKMMCFNCNVETTSFEKYGTRRPQQSEVVKQHTVESNMNKYGVSNPMKLPEKVEKLKDTINSKSDEEKCKISQAKSDAWKKFTPEEIAEIVDKRRTSYKESTGYEFPTQNPKVIETQQANKFIKYGDSHYNNIDKNHETKLKNHGNPYYNNRAKFKITMSNKTPEEKAQYARKMIDSRIKNGHLASSFTRYNYYGVQFDSSWELAVWIYCIDHNIPIVREPCSFPYLDSQGKPHLYFPDFTINGKLVEIKSSHYLDENGKLIPFRTNDMDEEKYVLKCKDSLLKHQCMIDNNVELWIDELCGLYTDYAFSKYGYYWSQIFKYNNPLNPSYWSLNSVNGIPSPKYYAMTKACLMWKCDAITPYDIIQKSQQYAPITGKGITPFDLGESKPYKTRTTLRKEKHSNSWI